MLISPSLRPRLEFAAKAFLNVSFAAVLVVGAARIREKAVRAPEHEIALGRWTVLARPTWATLDDVREVRSASGLSGRVVSAFDRQRAGWVEPALARSPLVRRVLGVRRALPDRLEAVLELRRPVAAVLVGGGAVAYVEAYVEVDEEGTALLPPSRERPVREGRPLRVITGASGPVPPTGGRFGADVAAAAALALDLDRYEEEERVKVLALLDRIDVANWGGRQQRGASEIALHPSAHVVPSAAGAGAGAAAGPRHEKRSRCVVEWGRCGAAEADSGEPSFAAKAARLVQAVRLFPGLEGVRTVRVAFADLVVVPDGDAPPLSR